jgi:aspartyl-tRNA(Asn)/glutamyl-tRNA(Gln) amidotransferase subunit A
MPKPTAHPARLLAQPSVLQPGFQPGFQPVFLPITQPIAALRQQLQQAGTQHGGAHLALLQAVMAAAQAPAAAHTFTRLLEAGACAAAQAADAALAQGTTLAPLAGLPVTVKDLFDVAGLTTMAGSVVRKGQSAATHDALAVARLRQAGAAVVGLTNMSEFAFSGVGTNPHHGTPVNPCDSTVQRVPGGSSSGAAVSVALGLAVAGLGSDTGGSIRIPAALCGLVGFKSTQRRTPLAGAYPLSFTLDTVCALARTVQCCITVDGVISAAPLAVLPRPAAGLRLAVPQTLVQDNLDSTVATAWARSLQRLAAAGVQLVDVPLAELAEIAQINAPGGLSAIEAWVTHRQAMHSQRSRFDPRVAARIALGEGVSAVDYITLLQRRQDWVHRVGQRLQGFDAFICPTVPVVAPPLQPLLPTPAKNHDHFFATNALLLRNPATVNFLDGCAFTLPCHAPGELPVGLMLAAPAGHDAALAAVALALEPVLRSRP